MNPIFRFFAVLFLLSYTTFVSAQEIKKKRGKFKVYYPSGKLHSQGKVKNHHRNGEWKYYDEEGNLVSIANFKMDTIDGPYSEFAGGKISVQGTYCRNKKCGNWKLYDQFGNQTGDENYVAGNMEGAQRYWYPGSRLRDSLVFVNGLMSFREGWYGGGGVKSIETYKNGLPEGRWIVYPENRIDTFAQTVDEYHDGKKNGWHYYWNGRSLIEAYHYADGLPDGTFTRYEYDGNPLMVQNYSKGFLYGTSTYYKDGKKLREENYLWNVKEGVETEYDRSERVSSRKWYDGGEVDSAYTYFTNGKPSTYRLYGGTKGMSNYKEWDSTGVLLMKGMMHNDARDGDWTTYYPNGKVRSTMHYADGQLLGLYTKYYPNGKKMIQYTFLSVGTNTPPDVWNQNGKMLRPGTKEYDEIVEGNRPGEIFYDPSQSNRNIIQHRVGEVAGVDGDQEIPTNIGTTELIDTAMIYSFCEIMPEFPGGEKARNEFVQKNFHYPPDAHEMYGAVYVEYIVETDGRVTHVRAVKTPNQAMGDEAVRVVSLFPPQKSGQQNGKNVRVRVTIPIRFDSAR